MGVEALRHLKYVFAAVELGSMRCVARAFGVCESTVSRNIGALEQQLDIQIFQRDHNGVQLTKEGRDWIESVRGHYDDLEDALICAARRNRGSDKLRIGLSVPFGREFLVRVIERFERSHADIDVTIQDGSCHKQVSAIRRRHLDIAFICGGCETRACQSEQIWEEGIAALLPTGHPLARKASLTWADLAGERLLVPQGADGPLLDSCLMHQIRAGEHAPFIEQCQACQTTVILKVQIGRGFTITGESFAKGVNIQGTAWRPITDPDTTGLVKAVWLESNPKRVVLRLLGIARNMARNGLRLPEWKL
ncbi:LysR family transcriptional regulator [Nitratireductor sp. ZSWI3]|uniref:LysR substrate-binding domain-containing protein n=1 Tax=Nitratireductor sp. ZSWI3 TaxID=2966359 RepID=UPI00214FF69A|nr:LysR family transcriptional regulator [Nitratireductor sp. ZSWI3]MCR4266630.1 LysR family transcriptional regulator [Nitratireductor sp. ZSWI3]